MIIHIWLTRPRYSSHDRGDLTKRVSANDGSGMEARQSSFQESWSLFQNMMYYICTSRRVRHQLIVSTFQHNGPEGQWYSRQRATILFRSLMTLLSSRWWCSTQRSNTLIEIQQFCHPWHRSPLELFSKIINQGIVVQEIHKNCLQFSIAPFSMIHEPPSGIPYMSVNHKFPELCRWMRLYEATVGQPRCIVVILQEDFHIIRFQLDLAKVAASRNTIHDVLQV
mmetsp:Transcript_38992/g.94278  ORF Transcript_38992/g.94278 Transcript_38992/m.94278 type:complete len:224 (-) Transcript_38992:1011-1682(-)